jgi:maleate cis-trans isomerase
MAFTSWRGIIGCVHPTLRPGSTEEVIRLLPEGIGVLSLYNNIRRGTKTEFAEVMKGYEEHIATLAEQGCDLIHPSGAPPFMVHGFKGEAELIGGWEKKYKVPMFTSGQNQVTALRALKAKSIIGATYFQGDINQAFKTYFEDAGFEVKCMVGMEVPFDKAQELSGEQVYAFIKKLFIAHGGADAIYMLGSGWRTLHIISLLEQDLETPVVHPQPTRVWEIRRRLHIREPRAGYGRLLAEMPPLPS